MQCDVTYMVVAHLRSDVGGRIPARMKDITIEIETNIISTDETIHSYRSEIESRDRMSRRTSTRRKEPRPDAAGEGKASVGSLPGSTTAPDCSLLPLVLMLSISVRCSIL